MRLIRNENPCMDFEFQRNFMELSSYYEEIEYGNPSELCQASWETARYINEHLPDGIVWDNEDGFFNGNYDEVYSSCGTIEKNGEVYAKCPDAYKRLDDLLPRAIEYGLKKVFGHVTKRNY